MVILVEQMDWKIQSFSKLLRASVPTAGDFKRENDLRVMVGSHNKIVKLYWHKILLRKKKVITYLKKQM